MKKLLFIMSVFAMMLVSCTQPVQEEIVEETPVVVEPVEEEPVQQPEDEETVVEEEPVEEEVQPESDVWLEVSFDETSDYSSEYIYLPVDCNPYEYVFKDKTNPNAEYQLFKFEYVKTLQSGALYKGEEDNCYKLRNYNDDTEVYDVAKLYKLYVNSKFTNDNVNFFYEDVGASSFTNSMVGYGLEKTDNSYNLVYKKFRNKTVYDTCFIFAAVYTEEVSEE